MNFTVFMSMSAVESKYINFNEITIVLKTLYRVWVMGQVLL